MRCRSLGVVILVVPSLIGALCAADHDRWRDASAVRGAEAVHRPLNPPFWSPRAYENAWKQWGVAEKPADYARAFRERYGLHEAPTRTAGCRWASPGPGACSGWTRAGQRLLALPWRTVAGQTIVGLGNTSLDMQSLYEELSAADGLDPVMPLPLCNVRGTSEASNFAIYLMQFRDKDLRHRVPVKYPLCTTLCEDVPAWWLFKKKRTIYHLGVADSRSVRTMMPFLLIPGNSAEYIKDRESDFADIRAFLLSIQPPKYPFPIDQSLASQGKVVFERTCARCHGTYGPDGRYPNKIIPLDVIGTDPTLATAFAPAGVEHYLNSWFAEEHGPRRRALSRPERRRLPGPSARRHLGDGTLPPQRLGADRLPGPEVEGSARGFHEEFPLRRGGFRRATTGPEGHPERKPGDRIGAGDPGAVGCLLPTSTKVRSTYLDIL